MAPPQSTAKSLCADLAACSVNELECDLLVSRLPLSCLPSTIVGLTAKNKGKRKGKAGEVPKMRHRARGRGQEGVNEDDEGDGQGVGDGNNLACGGDKGSSIGDEKVGAQGSRPVSVIVFFLLITHFNMTHTSCGQIGMSVIE